MENILELDNLTKYYGPKLAISELNLKVKRGEVFGFLGPNGAGKTTTIRILLDFIRATEGTARILGKDVHAESRFLKQHVTYLPSEFGLNPRITVGECLKYYSDFDHRGVAEKNYPGLAERFRIDLKKKIRDLSHGMRQKTAIVIAFMKEPDLMILDEPTQGLDPLMQEEFFQLLLEQKAAGRTVFLSSHVLAEVEKTCHRCGIIREGKIIEVEEVSKLKKRKFKRVEVTFKEEISPDEYKEMEGVKRVDVDGKHLRIYVEKNIPELVRHISAHELEDITVENPNLEEIFLEYYK